MHMQTISIESVGCNLTDMELVDSRSRDSRTCSLASSPWLKSDGNEFLTELVRQDTFMEYHANVRHIEHWHAT
jgi:hypothetical protein